MIDTFLNLPWQAICWILIKGLIAGGGVGAGIVLGDWFFAKRKGEVI